jgi:hypothetical protein
LEPVLAQVMAVTLWAGEIGSTISPDIDAHQQSMKGPPMSPQERAALEAALEVRIDESIRKSRAAGYPPSRFIQMRDNLGTIPTMKRLVRDGEIHSGFKKLNELGMIEETIEAIMVREFPSLFTSEELEAASFRLAQVAA